MTEAIKKEVELIDFASKIIEPHKVASREVDESDMPRVIEDSHILFNLCFTKIGIHNGAYAVAHSQITKDDPLRFFVTRDKEIIINPRIIRHTEHTVDSVEGCVSYKEYSPITVQRWNKIEATWETLTSDGKIEKRRENLSGLRARVWQHEICHCDAQYIFD